MTSQTKASGNSVRTYSSHVKSPPYPQRKRKRLMNCNMRTTLRTSANETTFFDLDELLCIRKLIQRFCSDDMKASPNLSDSLSWHLQALIIIISLDCDFNIGNVSFWVRQLMNFFRSSCQHEHRLYSFASLSQSWRLWIRFSNRGWGSDDNMVVRRSRPSSKFSRT